MWLTDDTFRIVVSSTPLISIDLVVQNAEGEVLLGQRLNRPAQGFWFVPGGRIQKNESLDSAFCRLTEYELGLTFERDQARFLGVYEHFYTDSVFGEASVDLSTHYVVLGYQLILPKGSALAPPAEQHGSYHWWPLAEMKLSPEVHINSRAYLTALG